MNKVNCEHWNPCSVAGGGCCTLGLHGGKPSRGVCMNACEQREPIHPDAPSSIPAPAPAQRAERKKGEDWSVKGPVMWAELHARPFAVSDPPDPDTERAWMKDFTQRVPCGSCKQHWKQLIETTPPDYSSRDAYWKWTIDVHNQVNAHLDKPQWTPSLAPVRTPTPMMMRLYREIRRAQRSPSTAPAIAPRKEPPPAPEVMTRTDPKRLILENRQAPGDILMLTAAVRDLHKAHPGRFVTDVKTSATPLWENNPNVTDLKGKGEKIQCSYPLINQSNQRPLHFIHGFAQHLEEKLGVSIPVTDFKGDIHLSDKEKGWTNQVEQEFGHDGPFWLINAGHKYDFTAKAVPPSYYQQVVDHFKGRIQFVQVGAKEHVHPPLDGVINLIGKTDLRQFVRLMYHAEGVICPVTFAMHLAAAVPTKHGGTRPCVVVAGGREPPHWEAYPGHQYLHTIGALPCCKHGGCWKSRCQPVGDGDEKDKKGLCERPVVLPEQVTFKGKQLDEMAYPECMTLIGSERIIQAVEMYQSGSSTSAAPAKPATPTIRLSSTTRVSETRDSRIVPGSFAWTSPYSGSKLEQCYRNSDATDLYEKKIKTEAQFHEFLRKSGKVPELLVMGNFVADQNTFLNLCREHGVNTVHGEDGFFPHYSSCHADPLGFCWESSLTRMTFRGVTDRQREVAKQARAEWVNGHTELEMPNQVKPLFVLLPLQLVGDKVNSAGLGLKSWDTVIDDARKLLPNEVQLVVKPHPRAKRKEIPDSVADTNTIMVNKRVPLSTLLQQCSGVIGVNSTVLMEARLMFHKPVWAYGKSWFTNHPELILPVKLNGGRKLPRLSWLESNGSMRTEHLDDYADWFLYQLLARQRLCSVYDDASNREANRQWVLKRSYESWREHGEDIFEDAVE